MTSEEYRAITGYEGIYEVSNVGAVRSLDRLVSNGRGGTRHCKERIMSSSQCRGGYHYVALRRDGDKGRRFSIHRLVATAFIFKSRPDLEVNHMDGNKGNNCVENLEWVTKGENVRHARDNGLWESPYGENKASAKLTNNQAAQVKSKYATGKFTYVSLAKKYGVGPTTIGNIVRGTYWQRALSEDTALTAYQEDG